MSPIVVRVLPDVCGPFVRRLVEREDRFHWTGRHARAAVDALVGMDVEHLGRGECRLVLARMDAVHGTDVHARGILRPDTGLADDIRHGINNDSADVRSRSHGAVYAGEAAPGPLRGLHHRGGDRGGRPAWLDHRAARPARRLRQRRAVRSLRDSATVWRPPRPGRARLARTGRPVRIDHGHLTASRRVADKAAAGHDDHYLETVISMLPVTTSIDITGSPSPTVVSP